ncbi:hypothetical protein H2200_002084 [Cladophialophora chaetospira]|uniref:Uncharacterized protein n=1 Tax=Cladophialophora chaetospira TaxID=386627 RepID=A0AA38XIE9_9EURO|nr:hypothetical protein H2200_002084 [Cladophialophora chaetospira]
MDFHNTEAPIIPATDLTGCASSQKRLLQGLSGGPMAKDRFENSHVHDRNRRLQEADTTRQALLLDIESSVRTWVALTTVPGVRLGMLFGNMKFAVQAASSDADQAFAVATFSFFRTFGQAVGVAVGGVVFQNEMRKNLRESKRFSGQASELAKDAAALVQVINDTVESGRQMELRVAYMRSLRTMFVILGVLSTAAFLLAFFVKDYDMDRPLGGQQGSQERRTQENKEGGSQECV